MIGLLLACVSDPGAPRELSGVPTELAWGVVRQCEAEREGADLRDWNDERKVLIVYGDTPEDLALAHEAYANYGYPYELRTASELSDEDRWEHLWILGTPSGNPVLAELNGSLPVWFEGQAFSFGDHVYDGDADGIALIHPSPFTAQRKVRVTAGNSVMAAWFAFWTAADDDAEFWTVDGSFGLHQEGQLCHDGNDIWGYYPSWADDVLPALDAWEAKSADSASARHLYRFEAGGTVAGQVDALMAYQEAAYDDVLDILEIPALDRPVQWYLYDDAGSKVAAMGSDAAGNAYPHNFEVHVTYDLAMGPHEDTHVLAYHQIGPESSALMSEGLAVMTTFFADPDYVRDLLEDAGGQAEVPPLSQLIDAWDEYPEVNYQAAGLFVRFLYDTWGLEVLKSLYVAEDLSAAVEVELGMTLEEVEVAWRGSLE